MSVDQMPYTVDFLRNRDGWAVRRCPDQLYLMRRDARKNGWTSDPKRALVAPYNAAAALRVVLTELWRERGAR